MRHQLTPGIVRFATGLFVGWLIQLALRHGLDLSGYQGGLEAVTAFGYLTGVKWLEKHVSRKFGWLLGLPAPPAYPDPNLLLTQHLDRKDHA